MSQIFDALTVAHHPAADRLKSLSPAQEEPTDGSFDVLQRPVVPADVDLFERSKNRAAQLPGKVSLSHKKVRNYLILAFFVVGRVLLGTNHAFRPQGTAFASSQSIYGVAFEGTVHPASEVRITAELTGTVSNILVNVGDAVQKGQQLLR